MQNNSFRFSDKSPEAMITWRVVDGVVYLDDAEQLRIAEMYAKAKAFDRLKAMKVDEGFETSLVANYCVDSDGITKEYIRNKGGLNILECAKFAINHAIKLAESQGSEGENE